MNIRVYGRMNEEWRMEITGDMGSRKWYRECRIENMQCGKKKNRR
jgi:hypothetical protein